MAGLARSEPRPTGSARVRSRTVSPARFRTFAFLALGALFVVVVTGAVVRLTASGLGCENWPRCGDTPFPEKDFHALVEFGNRVVALVAMGATALAAVVARRVDGLPGWARRAALAVALATLAQIPLGGLTVIFELHPLLVMSHFLLAMAAVGLAAVVAVAADSFARGAHGERLPASLARLGFALVPVAAAVVVTGAFVTAAGPHSGGQEIERLGNLVDAVYVHVRVTAVFAVGFLVLVLALVRLRERARGELAVAAAMIGVLLTQMAVGEIQWRTELPWWLVLVHVALATAVWTGVVALAALLRLRSVPVVSRSVHHTRVSPRYLHR